MTFRIFLNHLARSRGGPRLKQTEAFQRKIRGAPG
jgi:hypothetical protein